MSTVSRGFKGRRRPSVELPPGQYLVEDFPVLSAGPTPDIDLQDWELIIASETDQQQRWDWDGFRALPKRAGHRRFSTASPTGPSWARSRRGVAGHPAGGRGDQRQLRAGVLLMAATAPTCPWRT